MAILRGEEARQWLAQNPNKAYTNLTSGESIPRQRGGLEKFFTNLTKPIRTFLPAVQESAYTLQDLISAGKGDWRTAERPDRYLGMTEEESTAFREDPLKQGLKAGSALISYGMPTGPAASAVTPGARIASAAGRGAISGTMSGFGYSPEGEELSGTLTGGALGGLIGGATQGIGEASRAIKGRKLTELGEDIQKGGVGIKKDGVPYAESQSDKLFRDVDKITNGDISPKGIDKAYKRLSKTVDDSIKASSVVANTDDLMLEAAQRLVDEVGVSDDVALRLVNSALEKAKVKGPITAQGLATLKKATQPNALRVQRAFEVGGSPSRAIYADYLLNDISDKLLKNSIDDVGRGAYEGMAKLYQVAPDVIKKADKAGHITIANVKVPTANIPQKIQVGTGKVVRKMGEGLEGGGLASLLSGAGSVAQRATPGIVGAAQSLTGRQEQPQLEGLGGMLPPQEQGPQIDQMALIQAVLNGDISTSEADWLMEMLGGGAGGQAMPKTDSGRKAMVARDAALQALNILEQDPSAAGKLQGLENIFYDVTGQANTATEYKAQIEGLRSQVFNALGGTALSPTEKAQYEKFLPKQNDSPAQARQKLQILIPMMEALMGTEVDMPSENNSSALYQMLGL